MYLGEKRQKWSKDWDYFPFNCLPVKHCVSGYPQLTGRWVVGGEGWVCGTHLWLKHQAGHQLCKGVLLTFTSFVRVCNWHSPALWGCVTGIHQLCNGVQLTFTSFVRVWYWHSPALWGCATRTQVKARRRKVNKSQAYKSKVSLKCVRKRQLVGSLSTCLARRIDVLSSDLLIDRKGVGRWAQKRIRYFFLSFLVLTWTIHGSETSVLRHRLWLDRSVTKYIVFVTP